MLFNVVPFGAPRAPKAERPAPGGPVTEEAWRHLIHRRCGLAFREAQVPAVLEILQREMASRGMTDAAAYYRLLNDGPSDLDFDVEPDLALEMSA